MPENKVKLSDNKSKLNPQVTSVEIGIRNLRTITVYPLSFADQLKTTDLITQALQVFFKGKEAGAIQDSEFVTFLIQLIRDNIGKILSMVTDEDGDKILQELSNNQFIDFADLIYSMNFEVPSKKGKSLIEKIKNLFPSMRPSQPLYNTTLDTDLKTVTESPSETVVSP